MLALGGEAGAGDEEPERATSEELGSTEEPSSAEPSASEEPPAEEPPSPSRLTRSVPDDLVLGLREPLVALQETRYRRARVSTTGLIVAGGIASGVGGVLALGGRERGGVAGGTLLVGGLAQVTAALLQVDFARRRHAAFRARLARVEGAPPEAFLALAEDGEVALEREARTHAFATGLYSGALGLGTALMALSDGDPAGVEAGLGLVALGAIGTVHHGARWRASVRLATDFAHLESGVPTVGVEVGRGP